LLFFIYFLVLYKLKIDLYIVYDGDEKFSLGNDIYATSLKDLMDIMLRQ